jgi:hypothetical protein
VPTDDERIGLSGSTPEGRSVQLAAALSGQTGWRRRAAYLLAVLWLGGLAVVLVAGVLAVVTR